MEGKRKNVIRFINLDKAKRKDIWKILSLYIDDGLIPQEKYIIDKKLEEDSNFKKVYNEIKNLTLILGNLNKNKVNSSFEQNLSSKIKKNENIKNIFPNLFIYRHNLFSNKTLRKSILYVSSTVGMFLIVFMFSLMIFNNSPTISENIIMATENKDNTVLANVEDIETAFEMSERRSIQYDNLEGEIKETNSTVILGPSSISNSRNPISSNENEDFDKFATDKGEILVELFSGNNEINSAENLNDNNMLLVNSSLIMPVEYSQFENIGREEMRATFIRNLMNEFKIELHHIESRYSPKLAQSNIINQNVANFSQQYYILEEECLKQTINE